jgi:hypothetical protein
MAMIGNKNYVYFSLELSSGGLHDTLSIMASCSSEKQDSKASEHIILLISHVQNFDSITRESDQYLAYCLNK